MLDVLTVSVYVLAAAAALVFFLRVPLMLELPQDIALAAENGLIGRPFARLCRRHCRASANSLVRALAGQAMLVLMTASGFLSAEGPLALASLLGLVLAERAFRQASRLRRIESAFDRKAGPLPWRQAAEAAR